MLSKAGTGVRQPPPSTPKSKGAEPNTQIIPLDGVFPGPVGLRFLTCRARGPRAASPEGSFEA